ncbi:MAG: hypothetical protein ABIQ44_02555 [Chloroflexia bacterium]
MRFLMWQQTSLIIAFAAMLLLYIITSYHLTKGPRPLLSTLLRLAALSFIGSLAWVACVVLSSVTYIGLSDVSLAYNLVERTYNSTFGFPFTISYFDQLRAIFGLSPILRSPILNYLIAATIPLTLLVISSLVTAAERLLAKTTISIETHTKAYLALLLAAVLAIVSIPLWPLPQRNPEMPDVPIPQDALDVQYSHLPANPSSPTTSFAVSGQSESQLLLYYKDALQVEGWDLTLGYAYEVWPISGTAIFSKNGKQLEVYSPDSPTETFVYFTLWPSEQSRLDHLH